ncbi:MAG: hypothetical protein HY981_00970 [Candidatus Magasanikbacteria bacterium]|nr:hypothetical protein [Candidatus Magasanikbacteria bacterium]
MEYGGLQKLTTKEKVGFFAFLIFACATIIFGFRGIGNAIKNPFAKNFAPPTPTTEELQKKQLAELKTKDTDKDGLSDYDEIYVYNTSPYLADTDSDGASDKDEILKGTDPNCPKGAVCLGFGGAFAQGTGTQGTVNPPLQISTTGQVLLSSLLSTNPDPKTLRAVLIQNGVNKEVVNGLDDQALMALAQKAAGGERVPGGAAAEFGGASTGADTSEKINAASRPPTDAEQIRALLRAQGVSEEQLKKIDDATLLQAYKEVLNPGTQSTSTKL